MSSIATVRTPEITHVPTDEGTSARAVTPQSESQAASSSSATEGSDFLKSYANDSASEFRAPGESTSTHSPEAGAATPDADSFNAWLSSSPKMQKKYDKLSDETKTQVRQNHQEVSEDLNRVGHEAKTLPNDARREVEQHTQNAESAMKQGDFKLAKENLGYAKESLETAKHAGGSHASQNAEVRKWPEKSNAVYPHKGKHRPSRNTTDMSDSAINSLVKKDSSKGQAARYNTSVAGDVHKLEAEAYQNGYVTKHADGTAVHKFAKNIGASEGELTRYIRLDGTDHGHPITQDQFNNYIKKEADHLKTNGGDTTELSDYLNKIGENPQHFGITS